jgi:hypothetical protein
LENDKKYGFRGENLIYLTHSMTSNNKLKADTLWGIKDNTLIQVNEINDVENFENIDEIKPRHNESFIQNEVS